MTHHDKTDRELLLLVLLNQETIMASTTALTAAVGELGTLVSEVVAVISGNEDQAAIDAATAAIETAITDLRGALPKPAPVVPSVSGLEPASGAADSAVTIHGSGFEGATAVTFGSNAAVYTVESDTQITVTVPPGEGSVPVTVGGPGGVSSPVDFQYA